MSAGLIMAGRPGLDAIAVKGWFYAYKWLLLRRLSQLSMLLLFLVGPFWGYWIVKGNLSSSLTLDILPLTDPYLLIQSLVTGHVPEQAAITGAIIVAVFYLLVGGRVFCSWVCPINPVTDTASWLRRRLGLKGSAHVSRSARYWILGMTILLAAVTGSIVWELINPVSIVHREIIFSMEWVGSEMGTAGAWVVMGGLAWMIVVTVFLYDFLVSRNGWCGHICPVGAFYSLLGKFSLLRVSAKRRSACNDCMDCFEVCPEPQVIRPALKGAEQKISPVIFSSNCTNCGRCIDVCAKDVFQFSTRFSNQELS